MRLTELPEVGLGPTVVAEKLAYREAARHLTRLRNRPCHHSYDKCHFSVAFDTILSTVVRFKNPYRLSICSQILSATDDSAFRIFNTSESLSETWLLDWIAVWSPTRWLEENFASSKKHNWTWDERSIYCLCADTDLTKSNGRFVPSLHDVVFHSVIRVDLIMADGHQDLTSVVFHQRLSTGQALRLTDTKSIFFNVHMQTVSF